MKIAPRTIICDRCNKPVDKVYEDRDDFCHRIRITVECHGERQTEQIEIEMLEDSGIRLNFGRAFTGPKLIPMP